MEGEKRKAPRVVSRRRTSDLRKLDRFARLFDSAFRIPVIGVRFGWDSIVGLIPGVGDTLGIVTLLYYYKLAWDYRLGLGVYGKLLWNQGVNMLVGLVPLIGDVLDIGWKANLKNAKLLTQEIEGLEEREDT